MGAGRLLRYNLSMSSAAQGPPAENPAGEAAATGMARGERLARECAEPAEVLLVVRAPWAALAGIPTGPLV